MTALKVFLVFGVAIGSIFAHAQNVSGVFMVVKGDVKVTYSATKQTEPARIGRKVGQGDVIVSGPDSRAKIIMEDKNVLNIAPDSKVIIERYTNDGKDSRNVDLKVEYGKVRASVEQKYDGQKNTFNVKTPTAVAGVRGTDFITSHSRATNKTTIVTFHGAVQFGAIGASGKVEGAILVSAGMTAEKAAGQPPEPPKPMPKEEMQKMEVESDAAKAPDVAAGATNASSDVGTSTAEEKKEEPASQSAAQQQESVATPSEEPKKEPGSQAAANQPKESPQEGTSAPSEAKPAADRPAANGGATSANEAAGSGSGGNSATAPAAGTPPTSNGVGSPAAAPTAAPASGPNGASSPPPSASNAAPNSSAPARAPAAVSAPSMINARDLSPDMSRDIRGNMGPQIRPVIVPTVPNVPRPPVNNVIDEARRSGTTRVNIIPRGQ